MEAEDYERSLTERLFLWFLLKTLE